MEAINKKEYRDRILELIKEPNDNVVKEEVDKIIEDLIKNVSLRTFESNMKIFPTGDSYVRRV